jgi:hypothetical protein
MDSAIQVALIGAAASILAAIAGPWVNWWLQVRRREAPTTSRTSRRLFAAVLSLVPIGTLVAAVGVYLSITRFSGFAADFTPAWTSALESNGKNSHYIGMSSAVPKEMEWHEVGLDGALTASPAPPINYTAIKHYLYFRSTLSTARYSWTGFFLWRSWGLPDLNLAEKREIILVLQAQEEDALELGLKDATGNETKIALKVLKGWGGYRVQLARFLPVDPNSIQLFLLAHSRGVGSSDANTFRIAHMGTF